jgi:uncharacterized membrane protein YvbJ
MTLCPMCGNFTDNRNCEVCGIKLNNEDSEKDTKDLETISTKTAEIRNKYISIPSKGSGYLSSGQ